MSFFSQSSGFVIRDSHISEIGGNVINIINPTGEVAERFITHLPGKIKECDSDRSEPDDSGLRKRHRVCDETSDGLIVVQPMDIDLHMELTSGSNYRMHSACYGGRVVAVKVFDGPRAKQNWTMNIALAKKILHPNLPKIVGVSVERLSESPFIIFHGIFEKRMNALLANALRADLNKSVELSMKMVKGLACGLGYMESQNILLKGIVDTSIRENLDIFAGYNDEPVISFHLPDTTQAPGSSPSYSNIEKNVNGIEVLNVLCQKLFSEVNSDLYNDSPHDAYKPEHFLRVVRMNPGNPSNIFENNSSSTELRTVNKFPRRELWWKLDKSASNQSLDSIARCFKNLLDRAPSSPDSPPPYIRAFHSTWIYHRCPGYLREETIPTPDVSRSVIVSHQYPDRNLICSVCGQLVQYPSKEVFRGCRHIEVRDNHKVVALLAAQQQTEDHILGGVTFSKGPSKKVLDHSQRFHRDPSTGGFLKHFFLDHFKSMRAYLSKAYVKDITPVEYLVYDEQERLHPGPDEWKDIVAFHPTTGIPQ